MSDPFIPQTLISREAELQQIQQILAQDDDFLVVGAPGTGRRTLIREATKQVGGKMLEIDCLRTTNAGQFLRLLADSITDAFASSPEVGLIQRWILNQPLTLDGLASQRKQLNWHVSSGKEWLVFQALLELPQRLAEWLDCQVVIVFQNFPHMRSWDRQGKWEAYLRQEIQRQSRVSYGLVATVAEPWVYASKLQVIHLVPLQNDELKPWLTSTLAELGLMFDPETEALELFLSYTHGHLGDAIALVRRIWLDYQAFHSGEKGLIQAHHVHRSILALVDDLSVTFEALILLLPSSQVRVLESLALDPTDSPQSRSYIKKHQLSRGGGLQGALNSLEQKGLIYGPSLGYRIALPFLEFWLRQRLA